MIMPISISALMKESILLYSISCTILLLSCKKDFDVEPIDPSISDTTANEIKPTGNVILDSTRNIYLISAAHTSDVSITADSNLRIKSADILTKMNSTRNDETKELKPGDIIISERSDALKNGLLAKVEQAQKNSDDSWIVSFIQTGLEEVFKEISFDYKFNFDTLQTKDSYEREVQIGNAGHKLTLKGSYLLALTGHVSCEIKEGKLKKGEVIAKGKIELHSGASLGYQENVQKDTTIVLKSVPLFNDSKIKIGNFEFPLAISAILKISLKMTASGQMELSGSITYKNESELGLRYVEGSILPIGQWLKDQSDTIATQSKIVGSFKAGIHSEVEINFFEKKFGVNAGLGLYGILVGSCADSGLIVKGSAAVEATIGGQINLFSTPTFKGSVPIFKKPITLFEKPLSDNTLYCSGFFPPTTGSAGSHGDTHTFSPSGVFTNNQFKGEAIVLQDELLAIQVRQGDIPSVPTKDVTFNIAIAVSFGGDTIQFQTSPMKLFVNKVEKDLSTRIPLAKRGYILKNNSKITIQLGSGDIIHLNVYPEREYFDYIVLLTEQHRNKIRGILGNWNDSKLDDIATKDGRIIQANDFKAFYAEFVNSWRISDEESLFVYETGKRTADYTDLSYPTIEFIPTASQLSAAQNACKLAGVYNEPALTACIYDVAATNNPAFAESAGFVQENLIADGLIGYYPFNNNVLDESGWNNHGTLHGTATFGADRHGKTLSALALSGKSYASVQNNALLFSLTHTYSISGWLYVTRLDDGFATFVCKGSAWDTDGLQVELASTRIGQYGVSVPLKSPLQLNTWFFITMTRKDGINYYYINGEFLGSASKSINPNGAPLDFGRDLIGYPEYAQGLIDEIRIYNRVLSEAEIKQLAAE